MMDNNIESYDVCIVGASIAGNYLCFLLSRMNLKIVVIEEHKEIGVPLQCAGIVSQKLSDLIDLPKELILNRVKIAKIIAPSGTHIKLSGAEKPYILNRIGLDKYFYNKTKDKKNITCYLGEKFKSFDYIKANHKKILLIETSKRNFKTKILIGCDGPLSTVGHLLGHKNKIIYAKQIRIKDQFNQNEAVLYFNPRWKELFGWIVPEGNNIYRIGLASSKNITKKFELFAREIKIDVNNRIDQQGGIIPYGSMNKISFDNILLLGDAAGQVKATTGGGIIMLIICAKYAASCIIKCFKANKYSKKFIQRNYEDPCKSSVGRHLKIHYMIRILLEKFGDKDFENLFKIVNTSNIEHLISIYGDMDFPKNLILKLLKNPLVIMFLIKFSLKNPNIFIKLPKIFTK